ncbi:hypothetical protein OROHE_000215 [Orobanche hederae]
MAKDKGKKSKRKDQNIGQPNALIKKVKVPEVSPKETIVPGPLTGPVEPTTYEPVFNDNGAAVQGTEREREKAKHLSGFIFMCNQSTKLECYQYRVFGLPLGKKEVVEKIKPGAKLFLYDFELKLLYGIYEATSTGNLNLEPAAFRGRFPAQLMHKLKENYTGSKFKQELSRKQVKILSSAFRPLANVSLPRAMPDPTMGRPFIHTGRPPAMEFPYLADMYHSRIPPQHVSKVKVFPHGYHRASAYAEHVNPSSDLRSLTPASNYYVSNSRRPSFTEDPSYRVQGPSYSSYRTIEERSPPHDHVTSLERRYRTLEDNTSHDQVTNLERRHLRVDERAPQDQVAEQYYQQLADNVAAYNPAAPALYNYNTQPQEVRAPYYQDSGIAYNSNPAAAHYALHPDYGGVVYAPSTTTQPQDGISQAHAPVSSSYYAANQPNR